DLAINSLSHSKKPDPKNFAYEIPEDYTRTTMEELIADMGDEGGSPSDFEASLLAVGTDAPDVQFTTMDGKEASLADYKGKQVLLNFWFYH
ncbi:MAG: redoxin domain-containing protein, partial [Planctomycetes bacterium]|nr:redoxin domain-containing protein [Planctomycetota bacterium]